MTVSIIDPFFRLIWLFLLGIEDSIKFLEQAKDRLKGHFDAVFLLEISQCEKQLALGLHHDCIEHLNKIRKDVNQKADIDPKVFS